ncbi:hypothetical protein THAR02_10620 [Trichoderma harzianum]|uniref:Uncharacterized protein n=1 Tax=Trichoderma harzianum TaxID=5544 RepID=A0A0F9ZVV8_TRIHA|nr:hypothetical protein THAR02_10620 [Trichoderma harzianum]
MSLDESFLSPRGLLVNNNSKFVCDVPNFSKLQQATQATLNLPFNDQRIRYVVGFTDKGMQELYSDVLIPIMEEFYKIIDQAIILEARYRSIGNNPPSNVLEVILIRYMYHVPLDMIFDAFERLYGHESDNYSLREEVQAKMKERIDKLESLSESATDVTNNLRNAIRKVTEAEILTKIIGDELLSQSIIERLRECHEGERDSEDFDTDCNALEILKVSS